MSHYTDADVHEGVVALRRRAGLPISDLVEAVLDAVAPAIAARALREAADALDESSERSRELADRFGGYYGGVFSALRAAATTLRDRADEIEAGR